jgi:23S rRNA pseudouridine2605 synthase
MRKKSFGIREQGLKRNVDKAKTSFKRTESFEGKSIASTQKVERKDEIEESENEDMRLNKYLAHCGIASRRACADIIKDKFVMVNDEIVTEIGHRVLQTDVVKYKGKIVKPVENMIYLLMNKPKDVITTASDEKGRKTVIDIVKHKIQERVYPVGRLDRNTSGLLLLTNDGDLAKKLSHPKYKVKKIYHAVLDKQLTKLDMEKIQKGLELEDGKADVDGISYVDGKSKNEVGIEIHIGKNRIVRRIFEHLGYNVEKLDRVTLGGLTKKDLPRGFFRHLTEKEIIMLKHFK